MNAEERKAALAAYKERKVAAGIYSMRCIATAQQWIGRAPDLDAIQNRLRFTLQQGIHPSRSLQAAWQEHGSGGFVFEKLERLDETVLPHNRDGELRDRLAHWRAQLAAEVI